MICLQIRTILVPSFGFREGSEITKHRVSISVNGALLSVKAKCGLRIENYHTGGLLKKTTAQCVPLAS